MGVVLKNYEMFKNMKVEEKIEFKLKMRGVGKEKEDEKVERVMDMVKIQEMRESKKQKIQGGKKKSVDLESEMVLEKNVVMMDEKIGEIEKKLREKMKIDIREMKKRIGIKIVLVKNEKREEIKMQERIEVLKKGKIEKIGQKRDIYEEKKKSLVEELIGEKKMEEGKVERVEG